MSVRLQQAFAEAAQLSETQQEWLAAHISVIVQQQLSAQSSLECAAATPKNVFEATAVDDEWVRDWKAWAASHPVLSGRVDDSRETIYAGR